MQKTSKWFKFRLLWVPIFLSHTHFLLLHQLLARRYWPWGRNRRARYHRQNRPGRNHHGYRGPASWNRKGNVLPVHCRMVLVRLQCVVLDWVCSAGNTISWWPVLQNHYQTISLSPALWLFSAYFHSYRSLWHELTICAQTFSITVDKLVLVLVFYVYRTVPVQPSFLVYRYSLAVLRARYRTPSTVTHPPYSLQVRPHCVRAMIVHSPAPSAQHASAILLLVDVLLKSHFVIRIARLRYLRTTVITILTSVKWVQMALLDDRF